MRKTYFSDISHEQFENIRTILESARKQTRPRTVDMYDVFCAVLYVLKSGCQWRMLPSDFPKWSTVYHYFQVWNEPIRRETSVLQEVLKKLVGEVRKNNGRTELTSFVIVDAQSVKNTGSAKEKCYDAGKKVSGIKRHIVVDTQGLPHAFAVTTANVTDRQGAIAAFEAYGENLGNVRAVFADGGYTGKPFAGSVDAILDAEVQIAKRNELHTFKVIPKRWVVERSFAWVNHCRRLWKNCEGALRTSLNMMILAFISILLKRF